MPFYNFNSFTGRLKESSHLQPLYPLSTHPLDKAEAPKMIWDNIKTKPLKTASPSSAAFSTVDPKILAKFKKFQQDVEKPVFLMGGPKDKILFGLTCVGVVLGFLHSIKVVYKMAVPKQD